MMALIHSSLLYAGMILMQVPPAVSSPPTSFTDWLLQALPNVPIYVILAYIVINMQRDNAKQSERRDKHEDQLTTALVVERQRIDDIEDDRRDQWETHARKEVDRDNRYIESFQAFGDATNRTADILALMRTDAVARDRVAADAVSAITTLVTVGSKPLQEVIKDVGAVKDTSADVHKMVSAIYDRFLRVFPTDQTVIDQIHEILIEAVNKACEEKKLDSQEVQTIKAEVTIVQADTPPAATGDTEGGALPLAS
jgi:hypothetical protein